MSVDADDQTDSFFYDKTCLVEASRPPQPSYTHAAKVQISRKIQITKRASQKSVPIEAATKNESKQRKNRRSKLWEKENCHAFGGAAKSVTGRTNTTLNLSQKAEKQWPTSSWNEGWFLFPSLKIWWPENCRISSSCCTAGPVSELHTGL